MVAYAGLPAEKANQASALINVALNLGGSLGGSLANAVAAQRAQFHQARLTEHLAPSLLTYQETIRRGSNSSSSTALRRQPPSIWSSAGSDNSMIPLALFLLRRIDRSTPNKHPLQEA
jgi:23S rRNA maturation mini-RNase III